MSRVLVLEPDQEIRDLFIRMLRRLGHNPILERETANDVDVVLLEPFWGLGRRFLEAIRQQRPDVYVVCASIYPRADAAAVAPDAFLAKPVSMAALAASLPV